jgi:hypothetical protein
MITVSNINIDAESGYLGNKMFMLANALAYAARVGDEVILPEWEFQDTFRVNPRTSSNIDVQFVYQEPHFHYAAIPLAKGVNLLGYFQSEKYFYDIRDVICDSLQPNPTIAKEIDENYGAILTGETVGIHVRRGDYVKLQDHHPLVDLDYYRRAVAIFPNAERFIIVSNDIAWCKEVFTGDRFVFSESVQDKEQGNQSAAHDLFLFSRCTHQIICNSTFSWWGSYLNKNPTKRVIAPARWFGPVKEREGYSAHDIYLSSWTVLD